MSNGDVGKFERQGSLARKRSEPHSLHAWHSVLYGMSPRHHKPDDAAPVRTIAAAALIMTPDEVYDLNASSAKHKHEYPLPKLVILGVLAGAYIGMGFSLCCLVGGLLSEELRLEQPGLFNFLFSIFGFPMGLTLCVVAGADLFTSNCMYTTIGLAEGKYGVLGVLRTLGVSYFCNLLGALMLMGLMSAGEVFTGRSDFVIHLAHKKVSAAWGVVVVRGILCNWLVCLAVWQGNMARDLTGKFVGIFLPNTAFVAMGFEHSVANMFLIPMSMALGSDISVGTFVGRNLVPTTIGNIIGGAGFVGVMYALALGRPGHIIQDAWEERISRTRLGRFCGSEPPKGDEDLASAVPYGHHGEAGGLAPAQHHTYGSGELYEKGGGLNTVHGWNGVVADGGGGARRAGDRAFYVPGLKELGGERVEMGVRDSSLPLDEQGARGF